MIVFFLIVFLSVLYICWIGDGKNNSKSPPGPWFKFPVVGHIPFLGTNAHTTLMDWSASYGPVISIQLGSFPAVVINDGKILKQAFGSSALSGRPEIKILDAWSLRRGIAFCDGSHAREQRRFALKTLRDLTKTSESMEARILEETDDLIQRLDTLSGKSVTVYEFFNCNVINSLLSVLISKKFKTDDPQLDELVDYQTRALQNNGLLAVLGMYVPYLCSYFPEAMGYSLWIQSRNAFRKFFKPVFQNHLSTLIHGQPRDILDVYLEEMNTNRHNDSSSFHDVRNVEAVFRDFMGAGIHTTSSQLEWLIHYMAKCPSVQDKLIAELDLKLPHDRLPSLNDRPQLPYTEALIQELLRISTIGPFGLLHSALEDTEVAGYRILKDTLVIGNLYAVNNDPKVWKNPQEFRPERFIDENGKYSSGDEPVIAFGTGQRSCIGEGLARNQLFLFAVRIFQNFRVKAAGALPGDHRLSVAVGPLPFNVIFDRRRPTI